MKKITRFYRLSLLFTMFFGTSLFLWNCENDEEVFKEEIQRKYKLTKINENKFKTNTIALNKLKIIEEKLYKNNGNGYSQRYEEEQFSVNLNNATYIESIDLTYHSYTFSIKNNEGNFNINNLVLSLNHENSYDAFVVTYVLTEQERFLYDSGDMIYLQDKTEIEFININQVNYNRGGSTCTEFQQVDEEFCECPDHQEPDAAAGFCGHPTAVYSWVTVPCSGGGTTPSDGSPSGNTSTGGSNNTSSTNNPIVTSTVGITNEECPLIPIAGDLNRDCLREPYEDCLTNAGVSSSDFNALNPVNQNAIKDFINENGCNSENQEFINYVLNNNCETIGNEIEWSSNIDENEEPKWGQLANKQEILDEINNTPDLNNLPYLEQITALANHFEKHLLYTRNSVGELEIVDLSTGVDRYVYSEKGGWIDFHHVFKIFEWATQNGPFNAITGGEMGEMMQSVKDNNSAYSYEDLPSNLLGVAMYVRFSQDLALGNITWHDAVKTSLNEIDCIEPENAPNFEYIPHIINQHYPKNFTYSPFLGNDLKNYHRKKFCERPIQEQKNIKEAHEKFPR